MSQVKKISNIIFSNYKEGDVFTTGDIQRLAIEKGIIAENNDTAVNNTLFCLKNDIRIKRIGRGQYRMNCVSGDFDEEESTERLFEQLISRLKTYKAMNPISVDKNTMLNASEEVGKYRKYIKTLQKLLENK